MVQIEIILMQMISIIINGEGGAKVQGHAY